VTKATVDFKMGTSATEKPDDRKRVATSGSADKELTMEPKPGEIRTEIALQPGERVYATGGTFVGVIVEIRGGYFAVELPDGDSFWLSKRYAEIANKDGVHLSLSRDELAAHRLSAPGLEDAESARADAVIGDDEALEQRERMERELAGQRDRMAKERSTSED
jgi:hypothetical protein